MTERQNAVMKARLDLLKVGLKISELEAGPQALFEIEQEYSEVLVVNSTILKEYPATYCGIPLKQEAA